MKQCSIFETVLFSKTIKRNAHFLNVLKAQIKLELNKKMLELALKETEHIKLEIASKEDYLELTNYLKRTAFVKNAYIETSQDPIELIDFFRPSSYKYSNYVNQKLSEIVEVNVKNPEWTILSDGKIIVFENKEQFDKRKNKHRNVKLPITIHPRIARAMINISKAQKEILDPFVGTGGILIEGGLLGLDCKGQDIDARMITASQQNLDVFGLKVNLLEKDIFNCDELNCEVIVTDPPYLRNSFGNNNSKAIIEHMLNISKAKRIVFAMDSTVEFNIPSKYKLVFKTNIKVHGSLFRTIYLLELTA